jgi:hypothetical protein
MPKVTWLGDEDPNRQFVTEGGVSFVKGIPQNVNKLHMFGGINWFEKFKDNPTFAIGSEDDHVPAGDDERAGLMVELDKRGISFPKNATVATLRHKLAEKAGTGVVNEGATDASVEAAPKA